MKEKFISKVLVGTLVAGTASNLGPIEVLAKEAIDTKGNPLVDEVKEAKDGENVEEFLNDQLVEDKDNKGEENNTGDENKGENDAQGGSTVEDNAVDGNTAEDDIKEDEKNIIDNESGKGNAISDEVIEKALRQEINYSVKHSIIGNNEVSKEQFKSFLLDMEKKNGFNYNLTVSLDEFLTIAYEEAAKEGVRGDIVVAQAIHETGYFKFGGVLTAADNNFCGLGVTGDGSKLSFSSARIGLRAQVQHLKAYATTAALNQSCVDPRFNLVARGSAPSLEELAGKWAFPGYDRNKYGSLQEAANSDASYGQRVYHLISQTKNYKGTAINPGESTNPDENKPNPNPNPEDSKPESTSKKGQVVGISSSLNVRSGAGTNFSIIGSLRNGNAVEITGESGSWYEINFSGKTGYVSKSYIKLIATEENKPNPNPEENKPNPNPEEGKPNPDENKPESSTKVGQVTGISSRLNIRSGAGTNHKIIGTLSNGNKVTIISEENGWYKIKTGNGEGYVSKQYIKITSTSNPNPETPGNSNIKTVKVNGALNVRTGPGTNHSIIGTLSNGKKVTIKSDEGNWYKIDFNGRDGFVSKKYVH